MFGLLACTAPVLCVGFLVLVEGGRVEIEWTPFLEMSKRKHSFHNFPVKRHAMQIEDEGGSDRREKAHEAHIIPGLGSLQWGFPKSIITKLRYCAILPFPNTVGAIAKYVFCANGVYDPDQTSAGHQPMWADNYAAIYNNYVVLGSKITVHFAGRSTDTSWIVGIIGDDTQAVSSTDTTLMESNNSIWAVHGTSHAGHTTLSKTYEPLADIGIDAKDDGTFNTVGTGANPTQEWSFVVWSVPIDLSAATKNLDIAVQIEYTVKYNELRSQNQN